MTDTKKLWKIRNNLDVIIWGFKYDLVNNQKLNDALCKILEEFTTELRKIDGVKL